MQLITTSETNSNPSKVFKIIFIVLLCFLKQATDLNSSLEITFSLKKPYIIELQRLTSYANNAKSLCEKLIENT